MVELGLELGYVETLTDSQAASVGKLEPQRLDVSNLESHDKMFKAILRLTRSPVV